MEGGARGPLPLPAARGPRPLAGWGDRDAFELLLLLLLFDNGCCWNGDAPALGGRPIGPLLAAAEGAGVLPCGVDEDTFGTGAERADPNGGLRVHIEEREHSKKRV